MTDKLVLLETEGPIARVTLNNPPVNAVSMRLLDAFHAALGEIERGVAGGMIGVSRDPNERTPAA